MGIAGAVQCQLWATLQQAMTKKEAQGRVTRREQACTNTLPEHYPRPLTFWACGHPEPPLVPSYWTALDGFKDQLKRLLEEKSLAQSIMQQGIPQEFHIFCCLFYTCLLISYNALQFFHLLSNSSFTCAGWPKWVAEDFLNEFIQNDKLYLNIQVSNKEKIWTNFLLKSPQLPKHT